MKIAALLVAGLLLQAGPATKPAPMRLPEDCPRLLLTWHPGMPMPTTPPAEIGPAIVAAVWDSGTVLRAESIDRPFGGQVIERAAIVAEGSDAAAVIACIITRAWGPERETGSANSDQGLHACLLSRRA